MPADLPIPSTTRRDLLRNFAPGLGGMALASLLGRDAESASVCGEAADPAPHHRPRARRVIQIFLQGSLSHIDSFDYKPKLDELHGKSVPGDEQRAA